MRHESGLMLRDTLIDPQGSDSTVLRRSSTGTPHYLVYLYLSGRDLHRVLCVVYEIETEEGVQVLSASRSTANPFCLVKLWAGSALRVRAEVFMDCHESCTIRYQLGFLKLIDNATMVFREVH